MSFANPFCPFPVAYTRYDKIDDDRAREVTYFPGQQVCARIAPIRWDDVIAQEAGSAEF